MNRLKKILIVIFIWFFVACESVNEPMPEPVNAITVVSSKVEHIKKRSVHLTTEVQLDTTRSIGGSLSYQIYISKEESPNSSNTVDFFDATDMKGGVILDRSTGKGIIGNPIENLEPGTEYFYRITIRISQYSIDTDVISFTTEEESLVEGGIVFYSKGEYSDGWQHLVMAPKGWSDENNGDDPLYKWGCEEVNVDSTSSKVGEGLANTIRIIEADCAYDEEDPYAAKYIYDLEFNGYDDWFMPSGGELYLMIKYDRYSFSGTTLSSTQYDSLRVDAFDEWGYGDHADKGSPARIRPIRRF